MTTFTETEHPRAAAGTFTDKAQSAPETRLGDAVVTKAMIEDARSYLRTTSAGKRDNLGLAQSATNNIVFKGAETDEERLIATLAAAFIAGGNEDDIALLAPVETVRLAALVAEVERISVERTNRRVDFALAEGLGEVYRSGFQETTTAEESAIIAGIRESPDAVSAAYRHLSAIYRHDRICRFPTTLVRQANNYAVGNLQAALIEE